MILSIGYGVPWNCLIVAVLFLQDNHVLAISFFLFPPDSFEQGSFDLGAFFSEDDAGFQSGYPLVIPFLIFVQDLDKVDFINQTLAF